MDWKYIVTVVLTIAGVAVPLWLWRTDLASHSTRVRVVSQTALQPDSAAALSGLKISVDGRELKAPYLTVLEIENDGARPIPGSDFETPLEIKVLDKVRVVRAQVTRTLPKDLQPIIVSSDDMVKVQPLLLNPNDLITIALVTSGGPPNFLARARIAGISSVEVENRTSIAKSTRLLWLQGVGAFALLITYFMLALAIFQPSHFAMRRRVALFATLSALLGSGLLAVSLAKEFDLSAWQLSLYGIIFAVSGAVVSRFLNPRPKSTDVLGSPAPPGRRT